MKIIITETGSTDTLSLVDRKTGQDYVADFVAGYDDFSQDEEGNLVVKTQAVFNWWQKVIEDRQELEDRIADMVEKYGRDTIYREIEDFPQVDLEDEAGAFHAALDAFETEWAEQKYWIAHEEQGCWEGRNEEEVMDQIAKNAGYEDTAEMNAVVGKNTITLEEITRAEYEEIDTIISAFGIGQGEALSYLRSK